MENNMPGPKPPEMPSQGPSMNNASDNSSHKALAIVGYIIPILFFIPLLSEAKNNAFAKFHANQQLNLLILWAVSQVILIIPILGWIISPLLIIVGLIFMIMGVINAANNKMTPLPVIGGWQLLK